MREKYFTGFSIAAVYIGAVMGAGFATGQELMQYFVRFGWAGLLGIGACGGIFALVGFKVLYFMHLHGLESYRDFLRCILGKRLGALMEAFGFCFSIALYSSMLAATGALFYQLWGINRLTGTLIMFVVCSILVGGGVKSLGAVNMLLCPLLIGGSALVGLWLYFGSVEVFAPDMGLDDNIFGSAIVYVSYNIISGTSLLCALSKQIRGIRDALIGGVAGGIIVGLIGLALALPLYKYLDITLNAELPMLKLMGGDMELIKTGYVILLLSAIVTTAMGNCYSAVDCLSPKNTKERYICTLLVGIAALLLAQIGFQNIVNRLYYFFGCIGLVELTVIINLRLKNKC